MTSEEDKAKNDKRGEEDKKLTQGIRENLKSDKGTYLVAMEIKATYTQLITSENRRNALEVADGACQKGDFKKGLLDVTKIEEGIVKKGIMRKIGAQIVFFPEEGK